MRTLTNPTEHIATNPTFSHPALQYKFSPLVRRLQKKEKLDQETAEELFSDTIKFLVLCGTNKAAMVPPPQIDIAWHHFILFTREYATFCQEQFGGTYPLMPRTPYE